MSCDTFAKIKERNISRTGNGSYGIILPKKWMKQVGENLKTVKIAFGENDELIITKGSKRIPKGKETVGRM
ncbi:hypothetical protein [Methanococcoides sp. FTZ1]|uniref:hypothetical protein n=1 Tax=Methanococcoides sp. FTZ1 TaxID=3439061 RepID=UPI003F83EAA7